MDNGLSRKAIDRRRFLRLCAVGAAVAALPAPVLALGRVPEPAERALSLLNLHTGESLERVFYADGAYVPEALAEIDRLLRDHRTGEVTPIDPVLLDQLHRVAARLGATGPFHVISGYRSPATNAALRRAGHDVARHSFHLSGRAVDVRLPGAGHADLLRVAHDLRAGGVGDYPRSDFVHLDTGPVRTW